jgi:hypothetical protein
MNGTELTPDEIAWIRELRYMDGFTAQQVAEIVGRCIWTVRKYAPGWPGKVPVAPLREAFLASPMTAPDVAREVGWWLANGTPDSSRVKRTLGINLETSRGRRYRRSLVDAETVQLIAEAIGVAPWSVLPDDDMVAVA